MFRVCISPHIETIQSDISDLHNLSDRIIQNKIRGPRPINEVRTYPAINSSQYSVVFVANPNQPLRPLPAFFSTSARKLWY